MWLRIFLGALLFINFNVGWAADRIKFPAEVVEILSQDTLRIDGKEFVLCGILNHFGRFPHVDSETRLRKLITENKENLEAPLEMEYYQAGPNVYYGVLWNRSLNISTHSINEIMILEGYNRVGLRDGGCAELLPGARLQKFESEARENSYGIWQKIDEDSNAAPSAGVNYDCRFVVKFIAPSTLTVMIDSFQNTTVSLDILVDGKLKSFVKEWTAGKKQLKFPSRAEETVKLSLKYNKNLRGFCPIEIE